MNINAGLISEIRAVKPQSASDAFDAQAEMAARVAQQQAALLSMMQSGMLTHGLAEIFSMLTEITAETLDVGRVSIWRLDATGDFLSLSDLFLLAENTHATGQELRAARYPAYFAALRTNRVICAIDVARDPRTNEMLDDYLRPNAIVSMLDSAVWHRGEQQGVVCVESINGRRDWTSDEQQFVGSIADLVALAIDNDMLRAVQSRALVSEQKFSQAFRLNPDCMLITRVSDSIVVEFSDMFAAQSGYRREDVVGKSALTGKMWVDQGLREQWLQRCRTEGKVRGLVAEIRTQSGVVRTYQISSDRIVFDGEDCVLTVARDITENKLQERILFEIAQGVATATGEGFFASLVERLSQALGADMVLIGELVDQPAYQPTNLQSDKGTSETQSFIRTIAVRRRDQSIDNFSYALTGTVSETVIQRGVQAFPSDVATLYPHDVMLAEQKAAAFVGAPMCDSGGRHIGLVAAWFSAPMEKSDLTIQLLRIFANRASVEIERRNQLAALEYHATHDTLTGLQNRASLVSKIEETIHRDAVDRAKPQGALLLFDLDRFKEINDTLGHAVGDSLLQKIAACLAVEHLTCSSEVGVNCEVARLGGDEFAVWLHGLHESADAELIASRILATITSPFDIDGYRLAVDASVGIARYPAHGEILSDLLRHADVAMYAAKRHGSGYSVYQPSDDPYSPQRLALLNQLGEAIRAGQLMLQYQPRMNLVTTTAAGFEALVRWQHPKLGLLSPGQFIPLAELSDVIRPLTMWVLDHALMQLAQWHTQGRKVFVAVNISARHLMDDSFPTQLQKLMAQHHINPQFLELELTESAIIADPERATQTLKRIHEMGVKIAIDDFGTGYSSLSHLRKLSVNALKIDVSFVTNMLANEQDATIVESIIGLGHNLGLSVVAEGIEDEATLARLRSLGCDEGQGYFISRPMNGDAATAWLDM